ncbi:MAG: tyrosine--tRNA ligase [Cyclobacteriaceae bacterium]|nr:tyrosine--tRNA ligase [Cyclobacteriaceae bacterium]
MEKNFVEELKWRGMIQDIMPGVEEQLQKELTSAYIGFDPTADSLHIGSLVQIMTLVHLQKAGHKPFALVGGATGMVGDPSGKSAERNLLSAEEIQQNIKGIQAQLERFLDFDCGENSAEVVNNYDWFKDFTFLDFIREVGKHITINYMLSKDSVQKRLETGLSFTEFSYQLIQGYDFYWLYNNKNCKIQLGGSDQWGNIVTGTELIRRKGSGEAFAITTPLIKKADGTKFGKTESGNVWLDPERTSPYQFYQYWINASDEDVKNYIRIFTLMQKEEIEAIESEHDEAPHMRKLQKVVAEDITRRVHGEDNLQMAIKASGILFGKSTTEDLRSLDKKTILGVFEGVPQVEISIENLNACENAIDFLTEVTHSKIFPSKGEARRMIEGGGISINKEKVEESYGNFKVDLLQNEFILVQKGKKNYYLVSVNPN